MERADGALNVGSIWLKDLDPTRWAECTEVRPGTGTGVFILEFGSHFSVLAERWGLSQRFASVGETSFLAKFDASVVAVESGRLVSSAFGT